jgi:hypothetical protein
LGASRADSAHVRPNCGTGRTLQASGEELRPPSLCLSLPHVPSRQRRVFNNLEVIRLTLQSDEDGEGLMINNIVPLLDHGMPLLMMRQVDSDCPVDVYGNRSTCLKMVAHAPIHQALDVPL